MTSCAQTIAFTIDAPSIRGQCPRRELAEELEVLERTIYRDLTALSSSVVVPVYASSADPAAGARLIEEYRTTLTGLTPDETRALFMMNVPAPLVQLAWTKSSRAHFSSCPLRCLIPAARDEYRAPASASCSTCRGGFSRAGCTLPADHSSGTVPGLPDCTLTSVGMFSIRISSRGRAVRPGGERRISGISFTAAAGVSHAARVSQIAQADLLPGTFTRPADFELAAFWDSWCRTTNPSRHSGTGACRACSDSQPGRVRRRPGARNLSRLSRPMKVAG